MSVLSCGGEQKVLVSLPPHHDKVFVTEERIPAGVDFTMVGTVETGKAWYGSTDGLPGKLADLARQIGANVVIQVRTGHHVSTFSMASPYATGQAVLIRDVDALKKTALKGEWY